MVNKKIASEFAIGIVLLIAAVVGGIFWLQHEPVAQAPAPPIIEQTQKPSKVCTQEAKLCGDGSYVGRTGPNCEFAPCPAEAN